MEYIASLSRAEEGEGRRGKPACVHISSPRRFLHLADHHRGQGIYEKYRLQGAQEETSQFFKSRVWKSGFLVSFLGQCVLIINDSQRYLHHDSAYICTHTNTKIISQNNHSYYMCDHTVIFCFPPSHTVLFNLKKSMVSTPHYIDFLTQSLIHAPAVLTDWGPLLHADQGTGQRFFVAFSPTLVLTLAQSNNVLCTFVNNIMGKITCRIPLERERECGALLQIPADTWIGKFLLL